MQSVDEFTPSTTEPVFGSGLISQNKSQTSTHDEANDNEKVIPSSEPVVNGQNEGIVNKLSSNETITNGTSEQGNENAAPTDSSAVHVNGQNEKPTVEINNDIKPVEASVAPPAEPAPVESVPEEVTSAPVVSVEEPTTSEAVNDTAPEAPVATESGTTEVKSRTPRGRAKAPAVVVAAPTRQSTRGRKPAASSNADENASTEEAVTTTPAEPSSSSQRNKRKVATPVNDVAPANNEASTADNTNEPEAAPMAVDSGDNNVTEGVTKATPSPGKKRGAPKSTPASAKKTKGQSEDDVEESAPAPAVEPVQTTPKKARTSVTKKTPEPPSEEYARKLRPRK